MLIRVDLESLFCKEISNLATDEIAILASLGQSWKNPYLIPKWKSYMQFIQKKQIEPYMYFKLNRIAYIFCCLFFTSCVVFQAKRVPNNNLDWSLQVPKEAKKRIILFLGDSITHGRVSYDYVNAIAKNKFFENDIVVNEGINSRLTNQLLGKLDDVEKLNPDFVFILIGTNDAKAALNEEEYKRYKSVWSLTDPVDKTSFINNLSNIAERIKTKTKASVVFISLPLLGEDPSSIPFQQAKAYASYTKQIAKDRGVDYLPFFETLESKIFEEIKRGFHPRSYESGVWSMYWTILRFYSTTQTWDDLSSSNGYYFLTDGIHLNERAGKILESMILEKLK